MSFASLIFLLFSLKNSRNIQYQTFTENYEGRNENNDANPNNKCVNYWTTIP